MGKTAQREVVGPLGHALDDLIAETRLDPSKLARLSGVSRALIYQVLGGHIPSPKRLRLISEGLAKNPRTDAIDQATYARAYQTLFEAARYPTGLPPAASADWRPGYQQRLQDYFGEDIELVDQAIELLARCGQTERRFFFNLILGGVPRWVERPLSPDRVI